MYNLYIIIYVIVKFVIWAYTYEMMITVNIPDVLIIPKSFVPVLPYNPSLR